MKTAAILLKKTGMGFSTFFHKDLKLKSLKCVNVSQVQTDDTHIYTWWMEKQLLFQCYLWLPSISHNILGDGKFYFDIKHSKYCMSAKVHYMCFSSLNTSSQVIASNTEFYILTQYIIHIVVETWKWCPRCVL